MPWREALSLILSYPVWYDDGPDKLLNIDAPCFSLGFDSFEATVSKGKDELGQCLFRSWNLFGPFGPRNRPWESQASFCSFRIILFDMRSEERRVGKERVSVLW